MSRLFEQMIDRLCQEAIDRARAEEMLHDLQERAEDVEERLQREANLLRTEASERNDRYEAALDGRTIAQRKLRDLEEDLANAKLTIQELDGHARLERQTRTGLERQLEEMTTRAEEAERTLRVASPGVVEGLDFRGLNIPSTPHTAKMALRALADSGVVVADAVRARAFLERSLSRYGLSFNPEGAADRAEDMLRSVWPDRDAPASPPPPTPDTEDQGPWDEKTPLRGVLDVLERAGLGEDIERALEGHSSHPALPIIMDYAQKER